MSCDKLLAEFLHPADEFSPMPFWFWNDTLTEEEISLQMRAFKEKGVDGCLPPTFRKKGTKKPWQFSQKRRAARRTYCPAKARERST